jgi:hypothetical protein
MGTKGIIHPQPSPRPKDKRSCIVLVYCRLRNITPVIPGNQDLALEVKYKHGGSHLATTPHPSETRAQPSQTRPAVTHYAP